MSDEKEDKMPTLWTTEQLATAAKVDSSYIRRLLIAGKIQGSKIAKTWLISDDEARRWLAKREQDSE